MFKASPLLIAALLFPLSSHALDCKNAVTQADMNQCQSGDFAAADKQLNVLYNDYMKRLNPQQKQSMRDAQNAWLRYRDSSCKFESSGAEGGSAHAMVMITCKARKTVVRVGELEALSTCAEGDLGCPVPK
jgi:uncharacterized protein YecT (DUF1311 family)